MRLFKLCLLLMTLVYFHCNCFANLKEYVATGPNETSDFEKALYDINPGYVCGIYPKGEILSKGLSEKDLDPNTARKMAQYNKKIDTWLTRVLKEELGTGQLNRYDWLGIRSLRWNMDWVIGRFTSMVEGSSLHKGAIIEFQAYDRAIDLTVSSESLFSQDANDISDTQILTYVTKILNIPENKTNKINIEKDFITIAGINVCYGKMRCEWHERQGSDDEREWWSYIPFWYVKGKMFVHISTIEWKKGERPVSAKSTWSF